MIYKSLIVAKVRIFLITFFVSKHAYFDKVTL